MGILRIHYLQSVDTVFTFFYLMSAPYNKWCIQILKLKVWNNHDTCQKKISIIYKYEVQKKKKKKERSLNRPWDQKKKTN